MFRSLPVLILPVGHPLSKAAGNAHALHRCVQEIGCTHVLFRRGNRMVSRRPRVTPGGHLGTAGAGNIRVGIPHDDAERGMASCVSCRAERDARRRYGRDGVLGRHCEAPELL